MKYEIDVSVHARYLDQESRPAANRYVFAYTIQITNRGEAAAQLLTRHWIITDADGEVQEVRGEGVVGEQPHLKPGESFQYTSGAVLQTPVGSMRGSYQMRGEDGTSFEAPIEAFTLARPGTLH